MPKYIETPPRIKSLLEFQTPEWNAKLNFFKSLLDKFDKYEKHPFQTQIEQYIASYEPNEVKNNPKKIEVRLKKFFPEMKELFKQCEHH